VDRVPEPELMLDDEQARAYAAADFEQPHTMFVEQLTARFPDLAATGHALDLGCGPGDVTMRFARAFPGWTIDAIDGSPAMLEHGRKAAVEAGLGARIRFHEIRLPAERMPRDGYDLIFSNSLLHHLADPGVLWAALRRAGAVGSAVFVMDLSRPASREAARDLAARYAADEPEILRTDFFNSLLAAYVPQEIRLQLERAGLGHLDLEAVSDRHLVVWGRVV
jgi:trans-aconitate methyltransferase